MELRHLRYFLAVAEALSLRRAATRLCIAAPPLSVQIRKLEEEVGAELFTRQGRGIKLTDAGRVFLDQARKTLADAARAVALARQAAGGEIGHLSIAYNASAGFLVFPKVIPAYRQAYPGVQLTFHALNMEQQLQGLRREELDLGFLWLPVPGDEFDIQPLVEEPLMAVLPASHPLAQKKSIATRELRDEPLIFPSRVLHPDTYQAIAQRFAREGSTVRVAYELESSLSMINFVAMGVGCSLLPAYARNIRQPGVVYRPLKPPPFVNTLALIKLKGRAGLAEAFTKFTLQALGKR